MAGKADSSRFEKGNKKSSRKRAAVLTAGAAALAVSGLAFEHGGTAPTPLNAVLSAAHQNQQAPGQQANHPQDPHPHPQPPPHPHPHPHPGHLSNGHQPHPHPHPHP